MSAAIVLLSGGLDSATCLAIARHEGFAPIYTLAFDYGQRHRHELQAAAIISKHLGAAEHRVIRIDLRQFGKSALTADIAVPKDRDESTMGGDVPITYVPARNTIFLSYALAWAEVLEVRDVFIGVNAAGLQRVPRLPAGVCRGLRADGKPRHPDDHHAGRPALSRPDAAPASHQGQIIRRGVELGLDYGMTHSCYDPMADGSACGHCDSCLLRKRGFEQAGVPDPTRYAR